MGVWVGEEWEQNEKKKWNKKSIFKKNLKKNGNEKKMLSPTERGGTLLGEKTERCNYFFQQTIFTAAKTTYNNNMCVNRLK